jgi:hypothetical protein
MIDLILILIFAGVTWAVAGEGPWGAILVFFSVLLSGLLAMNIFEPVAAMLQGGSYEWQHRMDIIAFLSVFSISVWGLREATDRIMPTSLDVSGLVYETRWLFGAATGYTMMGILLTALHIAPLEREFIGFKPERNNLFDALAPDRQWMGFTQYVSEHVMRSGSNGPIFDGATFPRIPEDPSTVQIWSSFPIRYAQRRELYASSTGGSGAAPPSSAPPSSAPPVSVPAAGGGASGF